MARHDFPVRNCARTGATAGDLTRSGVEADPCQRIGTTTEEGPVRRVTSIRWVHEQVQAPLLSNYRVLIIEDDPAILHMLGSVLDYGGFAYETAETAEAARNTFSAGGFDVVLLDLSLPDFDGSQLIRFIRDRSQLPILVISGLAGEEARVDALDKGADDFIPKPFLPRELLARIRAALRRAEGRATAPPDDRIAFDPTQPYVTVRGEEVPLSAVEQQMLALFASRPGEAITNQEACKLIWGDYTPRTRKILYVVINRLRKKLERDPSKPLHLLAHHGIGYRLRLDAEPALHDEAAAAV